jgi:hypothetical protein
MGLMNEAYIKYSFFFKNMKGAYIESLESDESILQYSLMKLASESFSFSMNNVTSSFMLHRKEHIIECNFSKH